MKGEKESLPKAQEERGEKTTIMKLQNNWYYERSQTSNVLHKVGARDQSSWYQSGMWELGDPCDNDAAMQNDLHPGRCQGLED